MVQIVALHSWNTLICTYLPSKTSKMQKKVKRDRPTDRQTDTVTCWVACTRLTSERGLYSSLKESNVEYNLASGLNAVNCLQRTRRQFQLRVKTNSTNALLFIRGQKLDQITLICMYSSISHEARNFTREFPHFAVEHLLIDVKADNESWSNISILRTKQTTILSQDGQRRRVTCGHACTKHSVHMFSICTFKTPSGIQILLSGRQAW